MSKTPIALIGAGAISRTHVDRLQRSDCAIAAPTPAGRAQALLEAAALGAAVHVG